MQTLFCTCLCFLYSIERYKFKQKKISFLFSKFNRQSLERWMGVWCYAERWHRWAVQPCVIWWRRGFRNSTTTSATLRKTATMRNCLRTLLEKPLFTALDQMQLPKEKVCFFIWARFLSHENHDKSTFNELFYISRTSNIMTKFYRFFWIRVSSGDVFREHLFVNAEVASKSLKIMALSLGILIIFGWAMNQ